MVLLNGVKVFKKFPNGESILSGPISSGPAQVITLLYENDVDLFELYLIKKHLGSLAPTLLMPYIPYSRMDRVEGDNVFSLKYLADFINDLWFEEVITYDAHSDVSLNLIKNLNNRSAIRGLLTYAINATGESTRDSFVLFPDAGACKRYAGVITGSKVLVADKTRDFATGNITGMVVKGPKLNGEAVFIVDDLCSRGGTFMMAAKDLALKGAGNIYLVVTHCENTIVDGGIPSSDRIKKVFTTNSILTKEHEKIVVVPINTLTGFLTK